MTELGLIFDVLQVLFIIHLVYVIGAFLSWWTYFGVPVSMRP
jgi:hypothetical protein